MGKIINWLLSFILSMGMTAGTQVDTADEMPADIPFAAHYIDVGQADSALIVCDTEAMMIDGGNVSDSSLIASYLDKQGISELKYVVCTHAHEDHVGGLSGALSAARAEHVYAPRTEANTKAYSNFKKKVQEQGLEITHPEAGDIITLGGSIIEFIAPIHESGADGLNNTSIVLKITYGGTSFLFTGDAEYEEEKDILESGADISADVLKVGHHGSENSSSYSFLRAVMPEYAVISVGDGNSYGHPTEAALSRLSDAGAGILRTDESGTVIIGSDGQRLTVVTEK